MGHFSHTCKLTGLPITGGTPVVLFPIMPSNKEYEYSLDSLKKCGTTYQCSNDAHHFKFTPCWFPIKGIYNDYGGLKNIVEDDNTKVLEKYYGLSIQQLINIITCGRKDDGYDQESLGSIMDPSIKYEYGKPVYLKRYKELLKISGMWIHREIYDELTKSPTGNCFDKLDLGTPELLESLEFVEIEKSKTEKRYNRQFKLDNLIVNSDGTWLHVPNNQGIYDLPKFKEYCKTQGVELNISNHEHQDKTEQIYNYLVPKLKLKVNNTGNDKAKHQKAFKLASLLNNPLSDNKIQMIYRTFLNKDDYKVSNPLTVPYLKAAQNKKLKTNVVELWRFDQYMFATGVYYFPVGTAPQDGDHKLVQKVLNAANNIINRQVKKYYED